MAFHESEPIQFPRPADSAVVDTPILRQAESRILGAHSGAGQFIVLTGDAGAGKTTAARRIVERINAGHDAGAQNAYRAIHYVAADLRNSRGDILQRRLLCEFARLALSLVVPGDIRSIDVPALLGSIAAGLRAMEIQMVVIDEAGHIPDIGLDHLVTLLNTVVAPPYSHPLSIVLVGMHDLPRNIKVLPQVSRRVHDCIYFEACDEATILSVLRVMHPYFKTLDTESTECRELMRFLLSKEVSRAGLLGHIVPLVARAIHFAKTKGVPLSPIIIRAAHAIRNADLERGHDQAQRGWVGEGERSRRPRTASGASGASVETTKAPDAGEVA